MKFALRMCNHSTIYFPFSLSIVYFLTLSLYAESDAFSNCLTIREHTDGPTSISNYDEVIICDVSLEGGNVRGAAILNDAATSELSQNKLVKFSDNLTFGYSNGGACIANTNTAEFKIINNDNVVIVNNLSDTDGKAWNIVYGGALCNEKNASFLIKKNSNVNFIDNVAHGRIGAYTINGRVAGGAINSGINDNASLSLDANGYVSFIANGVIADRNLYAVGGAIFNGSQMALKNNNQLVFVDNYSISTQNSLACYTQGGAIANRGILEITGNGILKFESNCSRLNEQYRPYDSRDELVSFELNGGGAIYNRNNMRINSNHDISFSDNVVECNIQGAIGGGAILNTCMESITSEVVLCDNDKINFSHNKVVMHGYSRCAGGAIYNGEDGSGKNRGERIFKILNNDCVSFSSNEVNSHDASYGGAIFNSRCSTFEIYDNQSVVFSSNVANGGYGKGGAIYNELDGMFSISGNMHILFEKNVEILHDWYSYNPVDTYRLRSIYSNGNLQLAAKENGDIVFRDSIYATGEVSINKDYVDSEGHECKATGTVVITGLTTVADLKEMKGGTAGTAQEILNSRTSEIYTTLGLNGGTLSIEDGAILKGNGISIAENAHATLSLKNGIIDETGYAVTVATGNTIAFMGENFLTADSLDMKTGTGFIFNLSGAGTDMVELDAQLLTDHLQVDITGSTMGVQRLIALQSASQYDTSCWTQDKITVSGASFDDLVWDSGVLTYNPYDKFEININSDTIVADDSETSDQLASGETVKIDGNGHTLTVKNAVQLVQMALKNGTVKLEGENNGIVSVTLTEGGELVLTAGAGLKTGDIISMVANGKGELVISGDITIDEHGMKGKNGQKATVSNMSATTTGDAVFENVAFSDSLLDIGAGTTATFKNAVLGAGTRVTDAPATAKFENTLALLDSTNTEVVTESTTAVALQLYRSGDTANAVTLDAGAALVDLTCTVFDTITLSGSDLYLDLTALAVTLGDADAFSLTFSNGTLAAIDTDSLHIFATLDGEHYLAGYTTQQGGMAEKVYFTTSASVPEPATATLSLLALAALAARRRRK